MQRFFRPNQRVFIKIVLVMEVHHPLHSLINQVFTKDRSFMHFVNLMCNILRISFLCTKISQLEERYVNETSPCLLIGDGL